MNYRLSTGASEALKPYTTTSENGATRIEPSCLVSHEHKKLANGYRTIDDRLFVPIKKDAKVYLPARLILPSNSMRKISQFSLDAELGSRYGYLLCIDESRT